MIQIFVNGQELVLYKDTMLNMEFNNALFSSDTIEGDVVYDFDVPTKGNSVVLSYPNEPSVERGEELRAIVVIDGLTVVSGRMIVRSAGKKSVSVAIVCNPYPNGWSGRSVRQDGEWIENIVPEGAAYTTHKNFWIQFLRESLSPDSDIKFGVIRNEENYGNDNEDFGFWDGVSAGKYVNRLHFIQDNQIVTESFWPLIRLFNEARMIGDAMENNQFAFCPQLRLNSMLRKILESSKHSVFGDFFSDQRLRNVFLQSQKALDGSIYQYYNLDDVKASGIFKPNEMDPRFSNTVWVIWDSYEDDWYYSETDGYNVWDYNDQCKGRRLYAGIIWETYGIPHSILFRLVNGDLISIANGKIKFELPGLYAINYSIKVPYFKTISQHALNGRVILHTGSVLSVGNIVDEKDVGSLLGLENTLCGTFTVFVTQSDVDNDRRYSLMVEYLRYDDVYESIPFGESTIDIRAVGESGSAVTNIFAKSFDVFSCLPDISNSDFVNAVRKAFGLTYYINGTSGEIEVGLAKDLETAGSLDLSQYILVDETSVEYEDKRCMFKFDTTADNEDIPSDKMIGEVQRVSDLPDAYENLGMYCFVKETNAYWHSGKVGDAVNVWNYEWSKSVGNTHEMEVGKDAEDVDEIDSKVKIPTNVYYYRRERRTQEQSLIPDIPFKIESCMFGNEIGKDIILLYYRGEEKIDLFASPGFFESMLPVKLNAFGLSVDGNQSVGEVYLRKWLETYTGSKTITYRCRLPLLKAISLVNLLKPQAGAVKTRWVMVDNIRSMPKKISLQFENNQGMVLCEIETVRPD